MYSEKRNVLQLIALLKAHGVTHVVLSPGNRSVPLTESFGRDPDFTCYSVVDERSAAFFALGVIQKLQKPVAICCTSGTAVMNYGSAVAEAYYQKLPLLLITADRSARLLGQYEPQMIPQSGIFEKIVKKHVSLPEVSSDDDEWFCNRLINEALLELDHHGKGPVHINIELYGTLTKFPTPSLPNARKISRIMERDSVDRWRSCAQKLSEKRRILLVYGQSFLPSDAELRALELFSQAFGCAVVSDNLSNLDCINHVPNVSASLDMASDEEKRALLPELVITFHGHALPSLQKFIRANSPAEHWHVTEDGAVVDQFKVLTNVFECSAEAFLKRLSEETNNATSAKAYFAEWKALVRGSSDIELQFSDLYAIKQLFACIPPNAALHLANSSCVRHAQLFELNRGVRIYCNRGTNGIDGSLSTAVGYAAASDGLTYIIIGDLSFFYDMNGIWNRHVSSKLRIMLTNNGGAGIFQYALGQKGLQTLNRNIAVAHTTSAKGWIESLGFKYLSARNEEELNRCLPELANEEATAPILLEVFTSMENDAAVLRKMLGKDGVKGTWSKIKRRLF